MVDVNEMATFLNGEIAQDGDIVKILGAGLLENKQDQTSGRKYKVLNLPVRLNDKLDIVYSPNKDAIEILSANFGGNTESWVGKEFAIKIYPKTAFGVTKNAILPVMINSKVK